jgi:hypothetical protein
MLCPLSRDSLRNWQRRKSRSPQPKWEADVERMSRFAQTGLLWSTSLTADVRYD